MEERISCSDSECRPTEISKESVTTVFDKTGPSKIIKHNKPKVLSDIQQIHSQYELNALMDRELVILEFVTTWCAACKSIFPLYEQLAQTHSQEIVAAQVICDKNKETKKLANAFGVKSYPIFLVYRNGKEAQRWDGADIGKLQKSFEGRGAKGGKRKKKKK
jgi:thiol-disulfide isomerase/thioredoxin